jgi:nitroimidazol reductase NimA-like FMN-containing flavoprotein (pyridoxamine 5'-phosphate oxidase superfamily)
MRLPRSLSGLEIIPRRECLRLLAGDTVGRLGFVIDGQPMVLPVNYTLHESSVVFRTGEGSKLDGVVGGRVAFEVDGVDIGATSGWSVVVQGVAEEISDADDWFATSAREHAGSTWLPAADHYVRITPTLITGRRLPPTAGE